MDGVCSATEADVSYSGTQAAWTDHKCPVLVACMVPRSCPLCPGGPYEKRSFILRIPYQAGQGADVQHTGAAFRPTATAPVLRFAVGPIQSRRTAIQGSIAGRPCWGTARSGQPPLQRPPAGRPPGRRLLPMPAAPSKQRRRRRPIQLISADRDRTGATLILHDRDVSRSQSIRKVTTDHSLEQAKKTANKKSDAMSFVHSQWHSHRIPLSLRRFLEGSISIVKLSIECHGVCRLTRDLIAWPAAEGAEGMEFGLVWSTGGSLRSEGGKIAGRTQKLAFQYCCSAQPKVASSL